MLESQIAHWRGFVERHRAISASDVDEMEDHLREQIADLAESGLSDDESFLVAVKRLGNVDAISREFAREHSDRLWKQLVLVPSDTSPQHPQPNRELLVVIAMALGAAVALKWALAVLGDSPAFGRNAALLVFPFLAGYFVWKRRTGPRMWALLMVPAAALALVVNTYPFPPASDTEVLAAIHLPIVLWLLVGLTYVGGRWRHHGRRMDFIRFTGEFVVYCTLLLLGVGVLVMLTAGAFQAIGVDLEWLIEGWAAPVAPPVVVLLSAWLVEAKQSVIENIAPVLTRVFTPLTIVMLLALLVAFARAGTIIGVERELLILMDLILVLVLGLLLYAISARDPLSAPTVFDRLQLALVLSALAVDVLMLTAMLLRIAEFGYSPNKAAALGLNLVLLLNLAWSAWLLSRFLRQRRPFTAVDRWQTDYLPVYGVWALAVVIALPPLFGFG
ncbi:permease prefix domain 1-containing protein [Mycobacterium sp. IDR2000157661]|uniref:permease prefix domain 1-containing protein n=1 Tax=Mycobacterium sp. IDR2000157661 TaxID=2867005 RepID=UPI001EEF1AF8|nr:permease prefix domain 1-containing protein [Mycobacterium sp. IDR2000157661]ULE35628.1 permease prefix domain 1-containing protein [Mycobacterium sp. IDR2000157661]